jgi:hypothetical protein
MKLLKIVKIILDDKKYQSEGRHYRVTEINQLLNLCKPHFTKPSVTTCGNKYTAEYKRLQFWYDNEPITFKSILEKFTAWYVYLWLVYPNSGKCGLASSIVYSKSKIYEYLKSQSFVYVKIFEK